MHYPLFDLTEILYLSWFANCVVPAKLGDIYRSYLARNCLGVSMSKTVARSSPSVCWTCWCCSRC